MFLAEFQYAPFAQRFSTIDLDMAENNFKFLPSSLFEKQILQLKNLEKIDDSKIYGSSGLKKSLPSYSPSKFIKIGSKMQTQQF